MGAVRVIITFARPKFDDKLELKDHGALSIWIKQQRTHAMLWRRRFIVIGFCGQCSGASSRQLKYACARIAC